MTGEGAQNEPGESSLPDGAGAAFPVLGVGASAGGLSASQELLEHLGSEPGLAVVMVHHLDPTHASSLVEIFSRKTDMPVRSVQAGIRVEPNRVYVVPPNAGVAIRNGTLHTTVRPPSGLPHPIDDFFESLARDCGVRARGVVLSGTGSDGTRGLEAIRQEGGVTFAQDASAEYGHMPNSAIAAGCVDFVASPAQIARELARIGRGELRAPVGAADDADEAPSDDAEFRRILSALHGATGIDFAQYKRSTVRRRVLRRVLLRRAPSLRDYADMLEEDPAEVRTLGEEVLIHVTGFFRDPEIFDVLKEKVLPRLVENRSPKVPLRVWVPGCSTGEEVYSLAICLFEFLEATGASETPLKLFGTDVSARAIDAARAAKYPDTTSREVSAERLSTFFRRDGAHYRVRKDIRDACVFAVQDATRDPPFSGVDLVSCRNLMIYLGATLQDRVLPILHYALKEPGFLVLGLSESTRSFPGFVPVDAKHKIYARSSAAPPLTFDFSGARVAAPLLPAALGGPEASSPLDVYREADRRVLAHYAPPGVIVTDDLAIVQFRGKTGAYLEPSAGVASFDLLRMVRDELRLPLRQVIDVARTSGRPEQKKGVVVGSGPERRTVDLEVLPFSAAATRQRFYIVLFQEAAVPPSATDKGAAEISAAPEGDDAAVALGQELAATRDYLQSVIEQAEASNEELKAANEEIVSSNEELRSTNEELQMAKEELQATNEELLTVNDEMAQRNREGGRLNDDLTNVLSSAEIPIVLLSRDSRVRRFTPAAAKVLHLVPTDVGRPIDDIKPIINVPDLARMIREVLEHLTPLEATVQDEDGRWYQLHVRPYLTLDNRIDGTVLTAIDIDAMQKSAELLEQARAYAVSIVDTIRERLLVLEPDLRVSSANRAYCEAFGVTPLDVIGRRLQDLGDGQWDAPELIKRLRSLGEAEAIEDLRIDRALEAGGDAHVFLLNASRIELTPRILLAIEDRTEKERAERASRRRDAELRDMLSTAAEAIIMSDAAGRIVFANAAASRVFGYSRDEMLVLTIEALLPAPLREAHAELRATYLEDPVPRRMGAGRDLVAVRKDGTELPVEIVLGSMVRESGTLVVAFVTDITERRAAEAQVREYQERLRQMAFDAAVAEERERRRIAVGLHDSIGQMLALAQIKLSSAVKAVDGPPRAAIEEAVKLLADSITDSRTLIFELSPPVLYDLGLREALAWLTEDIEQRHGLRIELHDDDEAKPLDDAAAGLVFRAVRELLTNVFKHAHSPTASVRLRRTGDAVCVEVEDKGVGFDPDSVPAGKDSGFGLFSVREQIQRLGGEVEVASAAREGTRVSMRIPLRTSGADAVGSPSSVPSPPRPPNEKGQPR